VNQKNSMGLQAMHGAANRGSNDIIQFLAAKGAESGHAGSGRADTAGLGAGCVFLATVAPVPKPESIALLQRLTAERGTASTASR
jgi:hypothetical protein